MNILDNLGKAYNSLKDKVEEVVEPESPDEKIDHAYELKVARLRLKSSIRETFVIAYIKNWDEYAYIEDVLARPVEDPIGLGEFFSEEDGAAIVVEDGLITDEWGSTTDALHNLDLPIVSASDFYNLGLKDIKSIIEKQIT